MSRENNNKPNPKPQRDVKVVLLGDTGVGKSSLVLRFCTSSFKAYSESTIGASFMSKSILSESGDVVKFQIWDTAGQEKYHSLAPMYYRTAKAAVVVFDITRASTFHTLKTWITELQRQGPSNITIAIVGNKSDLEDKRDVSYDEAATFAAEIGAIYMETSAKADSKIQELFLSIATRLPEEIDISPDLTIRPIAVHDAPSGGRGCC